MSTTTRKQRERQAREELILDLAYEMVVAEGYLGLNMDRLAAAAEYSKGTLYQHFTSKEDILLALTGRTLQIRSAMFKRATAFEGRTRERLLAVGVADELFVRLYPGHFRIESLVKANSIWEKASAERQQQMQQLEQWCLRLVNELVSEAAVLGDLSQQHDIPLEQITFGLWTMSLGVHTLFAAVEPLETAGISNPYGQLRRNAHLYLDGLGWRPLFTEWDYEVTYQRIRTEIFAAECRQAGIY